jgi:hypothetical protein
MLYNYSSPSFDFYERESELISGFNLKLGSFKFIEYLDIIYFLDLRTLIFNFLSLLTFCATNCGQPHSSFWDYVHLRIPGPVQFNFRISTDFSVNLEINFSKAFRSNLWNWRYKIRIIWNWDHLWTSSGRELSHYHKIPLLNCNFILPHSSGD